MKPVHEAQGKSSQLDNSRRDADNNENATLEKIQVMQKLRYVGSRRILLEKIECTRTTTSPIYPPATCKPK